MYLGGRSPFDDDSIKVLSLLLLGFHLPYQGLQVGHILMRLRLLLRRQQLVRERALHGAPDAIDPVVGHPGAESLQRGLHHLVLLGDQVVVLEAHLAVPGQVAVPLTERLEPLHQVGLGGDPSDDAIRDGHVVARWFRGGSQWDGMSADSKHAIAGAFAGLASGIVTCPLDVVKTRLQAQHASSVSYSGMVGTLSTIWQREGIRGLYRGLGPICVGYLPTWAVYFTVYERCKRISTPNTWTTHCLSAMAAGAVSTTATNPIWVVKTRLMSQGPHTPWHYSSTINAFATMYKHEGIRTFYAGLAPALLGLAHVAVQFPLYEKFKVSFDHNPIGILGASALSKMCASAATYPHEVVRTRLQTQSGKKSGTPLKYRGIVSTVRTIFHEEGWRAFYAGLGTNMVRAVPASAVTLLTYESIVSKL